MNSQMQPIADHGDHFQFKVMHVLNDDEVEKPDHAGNGHAVRSGRVDVHFAESGCETKPEENAAEWIDRQEREVQSTRTSVDGESKILQLPFRAWPHAVLGYVDNHVSHAQFEKEDGQAEQGGYQSE